MGAALTIAGVIDDYTTWLVAGVATLGGVLALVTRETPTNRVPRRAHRGK